MTFLSFVMHIVRLCIELLYETHHHFDQVSLHILKIDKEDELLWEISSISCHLPGTETFPYQTKYCMLAKPSKNALKSEPHQNSNGRKPKVSRRARKELGGRLAVELVNKYINSSSLPEIPLFSSEHTKFASSLYMMEFYTLVKRRLHQQYKEL